MDTRRKATISDIASAAGVSKTTVSRYINGHEDMLSQEVRKRVEKAIKQAHYQPSAVARGLKARQSFYVGVIFANIATPFATSALRGISDRLAESGYTPMFADARDTPVMERILTEALIGHQVDGLIVNTTTSDNPNLASVASSGIPVVLCDRFVDRRTFDIAVCDYATPTHDLVRHVHDEGFSRVVLFTQDCTNNSPRITRRDAFMKADASLFGIANPTEDVIQVDSWDAQSAHDAIKRLNASRKPGESIAIYATNTVTLIATYNAIQSMGLRVPLDFGLCAPDDWGWAHQMGWDWTESFANGITTYQTNPELMGRESADLLIRRIEKPHAKKETRLIPTQLKLRESTSLRSQRSNS